MELKFYEKFVNLITKPLGGPKVAWSSDESSGFSTHNHMRLLRGGHYASSLRACMYTTPPAPNKYTCHGPGWIPHSEIILYRTHWNLDPFFSLPHTQAIRTSWTRDLERIQVDLGPGDARRAQGSLRKRGTGSAGTCPLCVNPGRVSFHIVYIWGFCLRSILNKLFTW